MYKQTTANLPPYLYVRMYMYACMYWCMHVCMMHECKYLWMHECKYLWIHVFICVCMHACMYVCMYVYMYVCMYACMYVCMWVCIHACIYVYVLPPQLYWESGKNLDTRMWPTYSSITIMSTCDSMGCWEEQQQENMVLAGWNINEFDTLINPTSHYDICYSPWFPIL